MREALCPVLTLQEVVARDSFWHHAKVKLDRLFVATDFSSCSDAALHYVSGLATGLKANVCVLHAAAERAGKHIVRQKLNAVTEGLQQRG